MTDAPADRVRWGLTFPLPGIALADSEALVRQAEADGYDDIWSGDTGNSADGFTPLVLAAAWTRRIRLGTGIVNVYTRSPATLAQHAASLQDASGGRFVLGLGSSSDVIVERWNAIPFERPLTRVRETVEALRPLLAGERGAGGFKLERPPAAPVPICVAALRDRMLGLAGEVADGAFVNFLPLSAVDHVVAQIRAAEQRAGRAPGSVDVVCRFFCIPQPADEGLGLARFMFAAYASVPVYEAFFRARGHGDQLDPMLAAWREGDRQRAAALAPAELISEIFIFGDADQQRERLERYAAGGIKTFVLTPITTPDDMARMIGALARR